MDDNCDADLSEKRAFKRKVEAGGVSHSRDEDGMWVCSICTKKFSKSSKLKLHVTTHAKGKKYTCDHCGKRFITKESRDAHVKKQCKEGGVSVDNGITNRSAVTHPSTVAADDGLNQITKIKVEAEDHDAAPVTIKTEPRDMDSFDLSMAHEQSEDGESSSVVESSRRFRNQGPSEKRMYKKNVEAGGMVHYRNEEGLFICSMCKKKFTTSSKLKLHVATHTGEKNYICDHCGKGFIQKGSRDAHVKTHNKDNGVTNSVTHPSTVAADDGLNQITNIKEDPSITIKAEPRDVDSFDLSMTHEQSEDGENNSVIDTSRGVSNQGPSEKRLLKKNVEAGGMVHYRNEKGLFICTMCKKTFTTSTKLKRHVATHTGEKNYICDHCGKAFIQKGNLDAHVKMHLSRNKILIKVSSLHQKHDQEAGPSEKRMLKETSKAAGMVDHQDKLGQFICSICDEKFDTSSRLKKHMVIHTGKRRHTCNYCGKSFSHKSDLDTHWKMHVKDRSNTTENDSKITNDSDTEKAEKRFTKTKTEAGGIVHYRDEDGDFVCSVCTNKFTTSSKLKLHVATHTGERNYTCDHCGKTFIQKVNLDAHMKTHRRLGGSDSSGQTSANQDEGTTEKRLVRMTIEAGGKLHHRDPQGHFICSICFRKFNVSSRLKRHVATHTGEKQHKCNQCGKAFIQKGNLDVHLKTHKKEEDPNDMPSQNSSSQDSERRLFRKFVEAGGLLHFRDAKGMFVCNICSKELSTSTKLKRHVATHTGEKNYKCNLCGKMFIQKGTLNIHMMKIHRKGGNTAEDKPHTVTVPDPLEMLMDLSDDNDESSSITTEEGFHQNPKVKKEVEYSLEAQDALMASVKLMEIEIEEVDAIKTESCDVGDDESSNTTTEEAFHQNPKVKKGVEYPLEADNGLVAPVKLRQTEGIDAIKAEPCDMNDHELSMAYEESQDNCDENEVGNIHVQEYGNEGNINSPGISLPRNQSQGSYGKAANNEEYSSENENVDSSEVAMPYGLSEGNCGEVANISGDGDCATVL